MQPDPRTQIERFGVLHVYPFAFFPMFNRFFSVLLLIVIRCSYRLNVGPRMNAYGVTVSTVCQLLVIGTYELITV
jgi:hypothetical protein